MLRNSSAFSDAPPIRPPSTSGWVNSSRALPALTLPPYRIRKPPAILASCRANRAREARDSAERQDRIQLPVDDLLGMAGLALGELLAHAQDGDHAARLRRGELAGHQRIVLPTEGAPLGVPHDHVITAHVTQHARRDLARVG